MPRTVKLYYKGTFDAAHYLPGYEGNCSKMHGHTWKVEVWLEGCVDPVTGMVLDFGYIQGLLDELDHMLLNERFAQPTAEYLAIHFAKELPLAYKVRVWESDHAYAEVDCGHDNALRSLTFAERERLLQGSWKRAAGSFPEEEYELPSV